MIAASTGGLRVIGAYFPNGQAPDSDKFSHKMRWLDALRAWVAQELAAHPQLVLMGDFNIAPEDRDVYDPPGPGRSTARRRSASISATVALGLHDAFRLFEQPPKSWSWWDYCNPRSARTRACASTTSRQRGAEGARQRLQHRQGAAQERAARATTRRWSSSWPTIDQSSRPSSWILRVMVLRPMPSFVPPRCGGRA